MLARFLSGPESASLHAVERRELEALVRERDSGLFHAGLLHLAGRVENQDRIALAAQLYSLIQNHSEDPRLRNRAEARLALFEGGGSLGDRAEFLARRFVHQATDPTAIVAMGLGGAAFRVARLGLLGRLISHPASHWTTRGFGARALAGGGAFFAESTVFAATGRGLRALSGEPQDWSWRALGGEWAAGAITLGALRGFGAAGGGLYRRLHGHAPSPWQGLYAQTAMFGGILSAHYVEGRLGLREEVRGAQALLDGFVTLLQFNIAGRLSREAFGPRWQAWERGLDQRSERLSRISPRLHFPDGRGAGIGPQLALASHRPSLPRSVEGLVLMEGPRDGSPGASEAPSRGNDARAEPAETSPPSSSRGEKIPSWWPTGEVLPETLRDFIDSLPDTTVIFEFVPGEVNEGLVGRILLANRKVQEKFGYTQDEVVGLPLSRFTRPGDAVDFARMQQVIQQSSRIKFKEVRFVNRDGVELYCDISGVVRQAGDRTIGFAILQDVTQRRRAQAQIQAEQVRYQALLRGIPDVMFRISREGEFLDAHAEQPKNFVVPPSAAIGTKILDLPLPLELRQLGMSTLERALSTGETQLVEYPLPMLDGTIRYQEVRMTASGEHEVVATIRDVTESRQAEVHRIAAARAESLKLIGRGLAHDANNALAPLMMTVGNSLELAKRGTRPEGGLSPSDINRLHRDLEIAAQAIDRLRGMIASFRELSLDPESGPPFNLHSLLTTSELQALVGLDVSLRVRLSAEPWLVPGPQENIHRVVQNLAVNARDAMAGRPGLLRVETDKVVLGEEDLRQLSHLSPQILTRHGGNFMRLRVQDNGNGIAPEHLRRIFEPYFSTKPKNNGAENGGLGLALTQKLVQDAGGFLTVESTPGLGTTFDVYLPHANPAGSTEGLRFLQAARGKPLLLVSENEARRSAFQASFSERGFSRVLLASGYKEALELAQTHPEIGALLTDFRLPGHKFGLMLLKQLRESHPELPAILWSEHDPNAYSAILGPYATTVEHAASPAQIASLLEDLMIRRLRDRE